MVSTEKSILRKIRSYWNGSKCNFIHNKVSVNFCLVDRAGQERKYVGKDIPKFIKSV